MDSVNCWDCFVKNCLYAQLGDAKVWFLKMFLCCKWFCIFGMWLKFVSSLGLCLLVFGEHNCSTFLQTLYCYHTVAEPVTVWHLCAIASVMLFKVLFYLPLYLLCKHCLYLSFYLKKAKQTKEKTRKTQRKFLTCTMWISSLVNVLEFVCKAIDDIQL